MFVFLCNLFTFQMMTWTSLQHRTAFCIHLGLAQLPALSVLMQSRNQTQYALFINNSFSMFKNLKILFELKLYKKMNFLLKTWTQFKCAIYRISGLFLYFRHGAVRGAMQYSIYSVFRSGWKMVSTSRYTSLRMITSERKTFLGIGNVLKTIFCLHVN